MSIRIYVGNLPKEFEREELEAVFAEFDESASTKVITDRKTGKCRGFGFVTVKTDEQADVLIEKFNGFMFKDTELKLEKALPRAKGSEEGAPAAAPAGGGSAKRSKSSNSGNKSRRPATAEPTESESVQPDPRWAQDLEKLKQLLAAQTTNS
ncbi:MAG: RNA-binding protein [Timaviella obliquedivisa GSE-PSE-MK23-08B]|jgi:RNA recognition motif-containing protein|nr:RNA-binding protein [Timaviella obliquedivisa GSE-PSE-MK23-08B]